MSGFVGSFLVARGFTTLFPETVVVSGGIHFHHFWYGLVMVVASGWLGIAYNRRGLDRAYALVFGLGGGLICDEVGLLLTLGNYHSELTLDIFIIAVAIVTMALLSVRYRDEVIRDLTVSRGEALMFLGIGLAAISALWFAAGLLGLGSVILMAGGGLAALGRWIHVKRRRRPLGL